MSGAPQERAPLHGSAPVALPDAEARRRAATDFAVNLSVTAGAGSGKTSLLIERLLEALLVRGIPLERIAAITFTDKAAGEMRSRLAGALAAVADAGETAPSGPAGRVLARAAVAGSASPALLRQRARLARDATPRVTTLHAFALALLHRHPIEAQVPAGVAIELGDGFARHVRAQLPPLIEAALRRGDAAARAALAELESDDLADLVARLAWLPEAAAAAPPELIGRWFDPFERELAEARLQLPEPRGRSGALHEQWDEALAAMRWWREQAASAQRAELPARLRATLDPWKKTSTASPAGATCDLPRCRELLDRARKRLRALLAWDERRVAALLAALLPWAAELRRSFLAGGSIAADGALALATALLAHHPQVRREEAQRLDLLLVDEFQDTDALQRDLVFFLCEQGDAPPAARAADVQLAPGRLFLVGDPKQSIYRFRGADLDVWSETRRWLLAQGGAELVLTTSFRSPEQLVAPLNSWFAAWRDPANDAEPPFEPLHAARGSDPTAGVEWWQVERGDGEEGADARAEAEGRAIADAIAQAMAPRDGAAPADGARPKLRDHVILLRRLAQLPAFAGPLRDRGIPFTVSGGRTFAQRSEIGELASLLLAAAAPDDEIAALGALRGPLGNLADRELRALQQWRGTLRWPALRDCPLPAVRDLVVRLDALAADLAQRPLAAALHRFVEQSELLPACAFARDGEQRIANVRKLADQVERRARAHGLPLAEAVREVLGLDDETEGEAERALADDELDAVRILTIHAAKGLEFDTVWLPDLGSKPGDARTQPLAAAWLATADGPQLAVRLQPRAAPPAANAARLLREERDAAHRSAESKRLLYVAMTRAMRRLILVECKKGDGKREAQSFAAALERHRPPTVVQRTLPLPERRFAEPAPPPLSRDAAEAAVRACEQAIAAARAAPPRFGRPSAHDAAPHLGEQRDLDELDIGDQDHAADARAALLPGAPRDHAMELGTVAHLALAERGPQLAPDAAAIARAVAAVAGGGAAAAALQAEAERLLLGAPARALYAALAGVRTVAIELPLTLWRDERCWRGAADLLFADGDALVIGDWKSDADDDAERLRERHRPQLALYRDALAAAWGVAPPRLELLLLRHGRRLIV
ncbi:MAG: UvrD-helicase domain-containing protein [Planctomycetes bacterium]|nr:UvrD-helicase domain-containing protein [Planctomycetota bacterium]